MYLFIKENKLIYPVNVMCRVLKVSESGYYRWLKNKDKPKAWQLLAVEINKILNAHLDNYNYGVKRMKTVLEHKGIKYRYNRNTMLKR